MLGYLNNNLKKGWILCLFVVIQYTMLSQTYSIKGKVFDELDNTSIPGAIVMLKNVSDTTKTIGVQTNISGEFELPNLMPSSYKIHVSYLGYSSFQKTVVVNQSDVVLPDVKLKQNTKQLKEVVVTETQVRAEQKGDTTQFNASAFKTNPDATTEDLVKKMPGVTSDGSTVKVNGEEVKKVLVDGKPFFGDDPMATLKSLPADMVDKIQIFDKSSDQAQFTGFKDGDEQKAINIITKGSKKQGQFGKIYAGYGTNDSLTAQRYNAGFTYNYFNGKQRLSLLGMGNNINIQNFNAADIMSVMGTSGGGRQGGGASNFLSAQQSGNTTTNALGLNFSDEWGKKIKFSGSYFFNQTENLNSSRSVRNYYTSSHLLYDNISTTKTTNLNHRFNVRLEYAIDSANTIIITPRFTYQEYKNRLNSTNQTNTGDVFLNSTSNFNQSANYGYNFQNDLLWQHKFNKKGRTVSVNLNTQLNDKDGNGSYSSTSLYNDTSGAVISLLDQNYVSNTNGTTVGGNITYTEPLGENAQFNISYKPSRNYNNTDKGTYQLNQTTYVNALDTGLSNKYNNTYTTQRGGVAYRFNNKTLRLAVGTDFQNAELNGIQTFPYKANVYKSFNSILPNAMVNYKFSKSNNINVRYSAETQSPSVSQLQDILDVSNPLIVKTGNLQLKQTFTNNLRTRIGLTNQDKTKSFFVFLMGSQSFNYISNATYILNSDTTIQQYTLRRGSQLIKPVNLDNYYQLRTFGVYSFPATFIKSNMSLNFGYSYTHTPALINRVLNYSNNNTYSGGFNLSSNISTDLDFSISYNGNYNTVANTIQSQSNSSYYNHTATLRLNYILLKRIVFNTDVNQMSYMGLSQSFNQNYVLWNAYIGYKFLKNQSLEAKVSVYDLLNQNRSVTRNITDTYTEDSYTQVLKRYFMLTLTYTFKKFKAGTTETPQDNNDMMHPRMMPPPGSMPPPPQN